MPISQSLKSIAHPGVVYDTFMSPSLHTIAAIDVTSHNCHKLIEGQKHCTFVVVMLCLETEETQCSWYPAIRFFLNLHKVAVCSLLIYKK